MHGTVYLLISGQPTLTSPNLAPQRAAVVSGLDWRSELAPSNRHESRYSKQYQTISGI